MLLKLMGGLALPAGELARVANVAPQTASGHLGRMVQGGLLRVECQGRHRYYSLANKQVGDAIEALLRLTGSRTSASQGNAEQQYPAGGLEYARTCYSHIAGWLGVAIADSMQRKGILLTHDARSFIVTSYGIRWFESSLGIIVPAAGTRRERIAVRCLDWTERRHHLAGTTGCALYQRFLERNWVVPMRRSRALRLTLEGKSQLGKLLGLPLK